MHLQTLLLTLTLTLTIQTTATPLPTTLFTRNRNNAALTESQLVTIAPSSKSCTDAPAAGECATAKQAAKFTSQSFDTYKVTSKAEQAAVISLMAFESGDFKYNKNHFPGVAGQGSEFYLSNLTSNINTNHILQHGTCNPHPSTRNTPRPCLHSKINSLPLTVPLSSLISCATTVRRTSALVLGS